jgi:transposase
MATSTRSTVRFHTPPSNSCHEANIVRKTRFFDAFDARQPKNDSLRSIAKAQDIPLGTAHRWLRQRSLLGSPAYRRTRRLSKSLGRKPKVTKRDCRRLVSPSRNPLRDQQYEAQLEYHDLNISTRTIQRHLKEETNDARRYKQAYIEKEISPKNKDERVAYGKQHEKKPIQGWWDCIGFTDEAHYDPSSQATGYILREKGKRYKPENIQQKPDLRGNKLHFAALITRDFKSELIFYHDEEVVEVQPKPPTPRPRKWKYELQEDFNNRLREWEATIPPKKEVKPKGNAMTQEYYSQRLLPIYIGIIKDLKAQYPEKTWILQEDGDPSHGIKSRKAKLGGDKLDSLCTKLRKENGIISLIHPPQSPDLNPIEGIWNILKQRVRRRQWRTLEELKQILQDEWAKITMDEIRRRIDEMPSRCSDLVKTGGMPIKSALW